MAEAVALAIEYVGAAIGTEMTLTAGEIYLASQAIVATAAVYSLRESQRRQQNAARDTYNASLRDRYVMTRGATEPRQVVLGRQRVSGPLAYIGSYGSNREHLVLAVILAAHEIDAIEAVYFDDERVTLDGSGNVLSVTRRDLFTLTGATSSFTLSSEPAAGTVVATVAYGTTIVSLGATVSGSTVTVTGGTVGATGTVTIAYQPAQSPWTRTEEYTDDQTLITLDASGNGTVTLPRTPDAGTVRVVYSTGTGVQQSDTDLSANMTVSGAVVTVTASPITDNTAYVSYRWNASFSKARVRKYLGAAGQTADAAMIAALPGVWTSAHTMTGLAYLVVELDYDPDAFPSGLPNVSALVRGAKLYDPRTSTTTWSENPALMMRYVATSPLLGRQTAATVNDASVITAANACDVAAAYLVNGRTYNRALYTAGLTVKSGTRAKDVLDDLARAMAGRWVFVDGQLRVKAGAYVTPLQTLDESWLAGGQAVQVQARANRSDVFNVVTGKFADETRDYIVADYPRVSAAAYITEDGAELPLDVTLNTVTFTGQAQQVAAVAMRDARQGLRVSLLCNMRAFPVEVFDTIYVTLPRFGWSAKSFEVLDVAWTLDGGIQLALKETDASIWTLGTSFADTDPAPNTLLPSPWRVPPITGLTCSSGTTQLLRQSDGTIISRIRVSWNAITDAFVSDGGGVEVRYGFAWQTEDQWQSVEAPNGQSALMLASSVRDGLIYMVKARAFNSLVRGAWCTPVLHKVVGKSSPPADVVGLGYVSTEAGIEVSWTAGTDVDYDSTIIKSGATWATATTLFDGAASKWTWTRPSTGTYTILAKHRDTSGNESTTAASLTVAYTSAAISNAQVTINANGTLGGAGSGQVSLTSLPGSLTTAQLPAIVDATKFASGVEPVTVVTGSTVPTTKSTTTIVLTGTGKLYRWNGTAYTATVPTSDLIDKITAGQIAAGAVSASEIAAGAIRAQHILVAPKSLNLDPSFEGGAASWSGFVQRLPRSNASVPASCPAPFAAQFSNRDNPSFASIDVNPGEVYRASCWVNRGTGGGGAGLGVFGAVQGPDGSTVTSFAWPGAYTNATGWVRVTGLYTVPATGARLLFGAWADRTSYTGEAWYADLTVERAADASLIVDGAITAEKMQTGLLSADNVLTRGLTVRDNSGNVLLSAGQPLAAANITPAAGWLNSNVTLGGLGFTGDTNATYGAVAGSTLRDSNGRTISDARLLGNALDSTAWVPDSSGSQPGFPENGTSSGGGNFILYDSLPDGSRGLLWRARSGSATTGNPEGGWNSGNVNVNASQMYRFSVWIRCFGGNASGNFYLGPGGGTVYDIGGGVNTNPYFQVLGRSNVQDSQWVLVVGYVYPSSYSGTQYNRGGVYRANDGVKIVDGTDFKWAPGATSTYHRAYQYYTTQANNYQDFWNPRVDLMDGTEPSLDALLAGGKAADAATRATWSLVTSRPTELTDGRVSTAINSNGVVISRVAPGALAAPSATGLYLGSDYLGYYNAGTASWRTYMDNAGNFFLGGTGGALTWSSGVLNINGTLKVGSSPAVSGTTMTGSGGVINTGGTFALGNASGNITYNGTAIKINGPLVSESNLSFAAFSASVSSGLIGTVVGGGSPRTLGSRSVTVTNGTSPYTYAWSIREQSNPVSGRTFSLTNTATSTVTVRATCSVNDEFYGTVQCVVTDANGRTAVAEFSVSITIV